MIGPYKSDSNSVSSDSAAAAKRSAAAASNSSLPPRNNSAGKGASAAGLPTIGAGAPNAGGGGGGGAGLKRLDDLNNPSNWKLFTDRTGMGLDDDTDESDTNSSGAGADRNYMKGGHTPPTQHKPSLASGGAAAGRPQSRARPGRAQGGAGDEQPDSTSAFVNSSNSNNRSPAAVPKSFAASTHSQPITSFASPHAVGGGGGGGGPSVSFADAPSVFSPDFGTRPTNQPRGSPPATGTGAGTGAASAMSNQSTPIKSSIKAPQNTPNAKGPSVSVSGGSVSFDLSNEQAGGGTMYVPSSHSTPARSLNGGGMGMGMGMGGGMSSPGGGGSSDGAPPPTAGTAARQAIMYTCPDCKRRFLRAPFLKHRKGGSCVFGDAKKRAVFDSKQSRLKDLDVAAVRASEEAELAAAQSKEGDGGVDAPAGDDDTADGDGTSTASPSKAGPKSNAGVGSAGTQGTSGTDWKKQSNTLRDMIKAGKKKKEHHATAVKSGIDISKMG